MKAFVSIMVLTCLLASCKKGADSLPMEELFTAVPSEISGITFQNNIWESEQLHYYKYQYIYIGGGVAAADFNNDGLQDLFFTSNIYPNKLFLNKGDLRFEDITEKAGIVKRVGFDTGVSTADINNDGYIDIYINRAGWYNGDQKLANMLYINNGDLTFTEKAGEFGIDDTNRSISSTFFDYDRDGDLDLYVCNAPADFSLTGALLDLDNLADDPSKIQEAKSSDRLFRNIDGHKFEEVTKAAKILPDLAFGLHAQVSDLNNDGWPDIYVSNDFIMPDFAYINNQDGTFTDQKETLFRHISYYSMGSDYADINNDGLGDLMVADMSPEDHVRSKTTMSMMSVERFNTMAQNKYHHQYMHNMLQLNNGVRAPFSEIANMSGIAKTDWSWATLFADFDLDGYNDIYVTNGVYRDVVHRDANSEINRYIRSNKANLAKKDFYKFTQSLPQQKLHNYFYKNLGNLSFQEATEEWADLKPSFSNGAVYVDLDNDGDLDVVTNNIDDNASLLRNNAIQLSDNNFLQLRFIGQKGNHYGVGTHVNLEFYNGEVQTRQLVNTRGYMSSMSNVVHFGLAKHTFVKKIEVIWSDGTKNILRDIGANQVLDIHYGKEDGVENAARTISTKIFEETPFPFHHEELENNDFEKQLLLPHKLSQLGPAIAKADLNKDGIDDLFLGGAKNKTSKMLVSNGTGMYSEITIPVFQTDKHYEDVDALFFDADKDGDQDLYVVSGSYEFEAGSQLLKDRLYLNQGNMRFVKSVGRLPDLYVSGSVVMAADYDADGDEDLFIGGRVVPGKYPESPKSTLLINENGFFKDHTAKRAPELEYAGMVTTAHWADINEDHQLDLVIAGEWMGIEVYLNSNGKLIKDAGYENLSEQTGWWNKIVVKDVDNDGDKDIIAGNLGLNYPNKASTAKPFQVFASDFDSNGSVDVLLAKSFKSEVVPVRGKSCTTQQMPFLKERIKTYEEFAQSNLEEIVGKGLREALHRQAVEFKSGIFINTNGQFSFAPFPNQVQASPINSIVYNDFDGDGINDLVLAGNNYMSEIETTRSDAGIGSFMKGEKNGSFTLISNRNTGFYAPNDVRNMMVLKSKDRLSILVANNNSRYQHFKLL